MNPKDRNELLRQIEDLKQTEKILKEKRRNAFKEAVSLGEL